ncbi:MAG: LUD domain-containing protein [Gammaproteobacteria bacterium]|nr:LUD domain-containing protein [Gammaproteobacteria bacterium]
MSQARTAILQRLRSEKWSSPSPRPAPSDFTTGPLPELGSDLQAHFECKLKANVISFDNAGDEQAIVDSVMAFLQSHELPLQLCLVNHPMLADLPWPDTIQPQQGAVKDTDLSILSVATAAIAETGSVVMIASEETPTEANFLPDNFICIVKKYTLLAHMEDLWAQLRQQNNKPPAVVNIISGPSRTADVEQTIQLGAHGPRRMHVIIRD